MNEVKFLENLIKKNVDTSVELKDIKVSYNFLRYYFNTIEEKEKYAFRTALEWRHYNCIAQEFLKALLREYHILIECYNAVNYEIEYYDKEKEHNGVRTKEDYIKEREVFDGDMDLIKKIIKFLQRNFKTDISEANYLFE